MHVSFLSAPGYRYDVSSGISRPVIRPDHILSGLLPLRSCIATVKPILFTVFFCNSCFSQYDTRCVCEKLIDKILSVSRETQYFSVFLRAFDKFSCEIRIKTGFLLFGSMRGVCLYFVAQCAFVPTRTVLAKCFSAYLLISVVCSAVFARFGWLNRFGTAERSVFLFERLFQLFEGLSCRLTEPLCAAGIAAVCRPCRAAFFLCLRLFCCG